MRRLRFHFTQITLASRLVLCLGVMHAFGLFATGTIIAPQQKQLAPQRVRRHFQQRSREAGR